MALIRVRIMFWDLLVYLVGVPWGSGEFQMGLDCVVLLFDVSASFLLE